MIDKIKPAEERIHPMALDDKSVWCNAYFDEVVELRAAYEALQKENAELKAEDEISAAVIEKCCNLLAQIAVTLKGESEELTRHGYHDLPELVSVLHVENELNKQSIAKFEQILEGVPEGAFDGGWTARGIMKHASDLEKANAAQALRIFELEERMCILSAGSRQKVYAALHRRYKEILSLRKESAAQAKRIAELEDTLNYYKDMVGA